MTKILFGFTVVAACVALLWAGIAGAQPGPPNPGPPPDGTITDNLTGLMWLQDANCPGGTRTWV